MSPQAAKQFPESQTSINPPAILETRVLITTSQSFCGLKNMKLPWELTKNANSQKQKSAIMCPDKKET